MKSHCTPRARDLTAGSTHRRVAVSVGMLAMKVISIVKKKEVRNIGNREQVEGHRPGTPSSPPGSGRGATAGVDGCSSRGEGRGAQLQFSYRPVVRLSAVQPAQHGLKYCSVPIHTGL